MVRLTGAARSNAATAWCSIAARRTSRRLAETCGKCWTRGEDPSGKAQTTPFATGNTNSRSTARWRDRGDRPTGPRNPAAAISCGALATPTSTRDFAA